MSSNPFESSKKTRRSNLGTATGSYATGMSAIAKESDGDDVESEPSLLLLPTYVSQRKKKTTQTDKSEIDKLRKIIEDLAGTVSRLATQPTQPTQPTL